MSLEKVVEWTSSFHACNPATLKKAKNVGQFKSISAHDPFQQLLVSEQAHILT